MTSIDAELTAIDALMDANRAPKPFFINRRYAERLKNEARLDSVGKRTRGGTLVCVLHAIERNRIRRERRARG